MIGGLTRAARRPDEDLVSYSRRRERVVSGIIRKDCPAKWGRAQRYELFTLVGHVARLDPQAHRACAAFSVEVHCMVAAL